MGRAQPSCPEVTVNLPPIAIAIACLAVLLAAVLLVNRLLQSRRREALRAAAAGLGLEFRPEAPELLAGLAGMRMLSHGHSHKLVNIMRGTRGGDTAALADHRWVTGGGKNRHAHRASLVVLRRPRLSLPHFFMRPQRAVLDDVGRIFGGQDIDFPDDAEFSKAFVLQGESEEAVRAMFGPSLRQQLRELARDVRVEGRGETLLVERRRAVAAEEAMAFLETATAMLEVTGAAQPRAW
jgi:hypothetical protein